MKSSHHFARALADCLRDRELSLPVIAEIARCVTVVHAADELPGRLTRKLLGRHARRPGPKRNMDHLRKIADAAIWARFNFDRTGPNKNIARMNAARAATRQCGLSDKAADAVFRAAFEQKDSFMRALIRERVGPRK